MNGIELAREFYESYGRDMLHTEFPEAEGRIAVGLAGHGSECFGFDDDTSRDHDFEQGFSLWVTDEDDITIGVKLLRAYKKLPRRTFGEHSALGRSACGVFRTSDFYQRYTGCSGVPTSWQQWMSLPSYALAEATNGAVFRDDLGEFSTVREILKNGYPEDVRIKKMSAKAAIMAQSGQYNFARCLKHGEQGAAMLALTEFVKAASEMIFLLNRSYAPYYKWMFRAMGSLPLLSEQRDVLTSLLTGGIDQDAQQAKVEAVSAAVIKELQNQGLTCGNWDYLEPHALDMQHHIKNPAIRNMNVFDE